MQNNLSENINIQVFGAVTSKSSKAHNQWTVNIYCRLYVGYNPFIDGGSARFKRTFYCLLKPQYTYITIFLAS